MAAKKDVRVVVVMACTECKSRNYTTMKNRQKHQARLELNKFCPRCRAHHSHREDK